MTLYILMCTRSTYIVHIPHSTFKSYENQQEGGGLNILGIKKLNGTAVNRNSEYTQCEE